MHSPDLIQRIYFEKEKGNDLNFKKVFGDLRAGEFDFIFQFNFEDRTIFWTCFESKKYNDIIKESDEYVYFYLWDLELDFEIVIPGATITEDLNKSFLERRPYFHSIWIIGDYFPGLDRIGGRPVKIIMQRVKNVDHLNIQKSSLRLHKMLTQYAALNKPICEPIEYPKNGEKRWKKIVDRKKR